MTIRLFLIILFFPILAIAGDANRDLSTILNSVHTMQGDFIQKIENNSGFTQQSNGNMAMQRPGKFRWEILNPSSQLIIVNNFDILTYDSDLKQVSKQKIDCKQIDNPVILLSGSTSELQKDFSIKRSHKKQIGDCFELRPKIKDSIFQEVTLKFVQGKLKSMYILDNLGQQTSINFINVKINTPLDKKTFMFTPPKGVDVL